MFLGSVSERTARASSTPVLIVPRLHGAPKPPERMLVGVDFSTGARAALRMASRLGEAFGPGSRLLLAHVHPDDRPRSARRTSPTSDTTFETEQLARWAGSTVDGGVPCDVMTVVGYPEQLLPLTASMILWINLLTDSLPALATGLDVNPGVMERPPRDPKSPLLDWASLVFVLAVGMILAVIPGLLLVLVPDAEAGVSREVARTMAFHVLVCGQLLSTYHARRVVGFSPTNRAFHAAVGCSLLAQLLVGTVPQLRPLLGLEALTLSQWGVVALCTGAGLLVVEVLTRWLRPKPASPAEPGPAPS